MGSEILFERAISPLKEVAAFEYLYKDRFTSLKNITEATVLSEKLPSEVFDEIYGMFIPDGYPELEQFVKGRLGGTRAAIRYTPSWPEKLRGSQRPSPVIYYQGDIGLLEAKSISIVGARKASDAGLSCAGTLAQDLSAREYTVVSGLAKGIDTVAMTCAIEAGGNVIGVVGTPLDTVYPKENAELQRHVAKEHLLVSQVPIYRYYHQDFKSKRFYFPERNELMAAISDATVVVEASDTSGTLIQARACLHQRRPLFILKACLRNPDIVWPQRFLKKENVYEVEDANEIVSILASREQSTAYAQ
jgi:DNA processing protein